MKICAQALLLTALAAIAHAESVKLPSYIKQCSRSDPDFNGCVLRNGNAAIPSLIKGDPKLRIPPLDPLKVEHVKVEQGEGPVGITLLLNDALVYGLRNAEIKGANFDLAKKVLSVDIYVKGTDLQVISKYDITGKVLLLPIKGTGDMNLTLENLSGTYKTGYDLYKKDDGLEYLKFTDSEFTFNIARAYFNFQNLFNGDKALAPYLKPCSRNDPNFNSCALRNGVAAIPSLVKGDRKYHIPVLDPLHLQHVDIAQGTGPVKINLALDDVDISGLKGAELKAVNFDEKNKEISVELFVKGQAVNVDSKYKIDGQVLVLPVTGNGDMNLKIENLSVTFKCGYDLVRKPDGKEYIKLRDSSVDFTLTKAFFDFENLFNGDKALGDNMNVFLNENWQDVFTEVKPVLTETIRIVIANILDEVLTSVPYDEIITA